MVADRDPADFSCWQHRLAGARIAKEIEPRSLGKRPVGANEVSYLERPRTLFESVRIPAQTALDEGGKPPERPLHLAVGEALGAASSPIVGYEQMEGLIFEGVAADLDAALSMEADFCVAGLSCPCQSLGDQLRECLEPEPTLWLGFCGRECLLKELLSVSLDLHQLCAPDAACITAVRSSSRVRRQGSHAAIASR